MSGCNFHREAYDDAYSGEPDSPHSHMYPPKNHGHYESKEWRMFKFDFILEKRNVGKDHDTWHIVRRSNGELRKATAEEVSLWMELEKFHGDRARLHDIIHEAFRASRAVGQ